MRTETRRQKIEGIHFRKGSFPNQAILDEDERTVRISISSELPVTRQSFFSDPWIETLGHGTDEVNLSRLRNGASVHYNHSRKRGDRIGVVESVDLVSIRDDSGKQRLEGVVRISKREDVDDIWNDIRDGIIRNVSVGYTIDERTLTRHSNNGSPDEFRVTKWTPMEVSFVDIPADPTVGVGRNDSGELEYRICDLKRSSEEMKTTIPNGDDKGYAAGVAAERARVADINAIFAPFAATQAVLRDACIADNVGLEDARQQLLTAIGKDVTPGQTRDAYFPGEYRDDARISSPGRGDDFQQAATDALVGRANIRIEKPHPGAQDLRGVSLIDMARMCVSRDGRNAGGMSKTQLLERALSTSDFPLILQNAASKSTLTGYNEAPATHTGITRETFVPDFKTAFRVAASEGPNLELVTEDGEFKYGALTETGASVQLATYGKLLSVTRQTLVNDDLNEILRVLRSTGTAAARLEADIVWGLLISNPVMPDGQTLFHATHNNIAAAAALSVAALGEMRKLLRLQKGIGGVALLDLQPFALIVPAALETEAEQLLKSIADPAGVNQQTFNPFAQIGLSLIVEPRLDADSATRYYLTTDADNFTWFDRVFLEGQPTPFIAEQQGWSIDGTEIKTRHDFAAVINEYRGVVKNDGV